MKRLAISALTSAIICGSGIAQNETQRNSRDAVLELTMTLIPPNANSAAAVTAIIELPEKLRGDAIANTHDGQHSARGLDNADAAREAGRMLGESAAAAARDNRESASRASRPAGNQPPPANPQPPDRFTLPSR